jgi:hypothetical protein
MGNRTSSTAPAPAFTVETLATRLSKPETWVRKNAERIPGAFRLTQHWRFDNERVEAWIAAGADLGSRE